MFELVAKIRNGLSWCRVGANDGLRDYGSDNRNY